MYSIRKDSKKEAKERRIRTQLRRKGNVKKCRTGMNGEDERSE